MSLIRENVELNCDILKAKAFSINYLEWGQHEETDSMGINDDKLFPSSSNKFDLVLASDVIYFGGCLQPLVSSIKHFTKPSSGRCLLVSDGMRYEVFQDRFEALLKEAGMVRLYNDRQFYKGHYYNV